jgi:NAD-dependent SIR2 family protein deacetylase
MKKLYLFLLFITSNTQTNILLQKPKTLPQKNIENLAIDWQTSFNWKFGKSSNFTCFYQNSQASFILQIFRIPIRSYNFQYVENIKRIFQQFKNKELKSYYFETPLKLNSQLPKKINFEELCDLLKNKKFVFYTGAGISASGKVATMKTLEKSLKFYPLKSFIKSLFLKPKTITDAFENFCKSAIHNPPTLAHFALHKIAQSKSCCILTENVDLLQQRTGSEPIFMYSDIAHSITQDDLLEVDILICVGLNHDDRGFIAHYKKQNPNGTLIAIDLGMPNYLSDSDFIIQEDLQVILPKLENILVA